jgi:hypothetical protein
MLCTKVSIPTIKTEPNPVFNCHLGRLYTHGKCLCGAEARPSLNEDLLEALELQEYLPEALELHEYASEAFELNEDQPEAFELHEYLPEALELHEYLLGAL